MAELLGCTLALWVLLIACLYLSDVFFRLTEPAQPLDPNEFLGKELASLHEQHSWTATLALTDTRPEDWDAAIYSHQDVWGQDYYLALQLDESQRVAAVKMSKGNVSHVDPQKFVGWSLEDLESQLGEGFDPFPSETWDKGFYLSGGGELMNSGGALLQVKLDKRQKVVAADLRYPDS